MTTGKPTPPAVDAQHLAADSLLPRPVEPGVIDSAHLFNGATELRVRHRGEEYRLRITRQGKLILTK